jgi:hypothetical protein
MFVTIWLTFIQQSGAVRHKTGRRLHPNGMSSQIRRCMERIGSNNAARIVISVSHGGDVDDGKWRGFEILQCTLAGGIKTTQIYTHVSIKRLYRVHPKDSSSTQPKGG